MTSFISEPQDIHASPEQVTQFMNDISNFRHIMPEQIENWKTDHESCSFFVKNLGQLSMQKGTFDAPQRYEFRSTPDSKVVFTLVFHLTENTPGKFTGHFEILTEVNPLMELMVRRPLNNFVGILTNNLKKKIK